MTAVLERMLPADPAIRAAALSVALSSTLMVAKLSIGVVSGSVAVISDGIDSLEDTIAAGIVLASVRFAARPADAGHPYGHGRAETIGATLQAVLIAGGGIVILISSAIRVADPPAEIDTSLALGVMFLAAVANLALVQYTGRVARSTGSPAIASEARHLWTNVVQAGAVILGLAIVAITGEVALDGVIAFVLGLYLLWIAGGIIWRAGGDVLDASLEPGEVQSIQRAIEAEGVPVESFHALRTRRSGQVRQIDFHLVLPAEMSIGDAHTVTERIEARIEALWPGSVVTVHVDPGHAGPGKGTSRAGL